MLQYVRNMTNGEIRFLETSGLIQDHDFKTPI